MPLKGYLQRGCIDAVAAFSDLSAGLAVFFVITAKLQQLNRIATVEILFVRRNCVNAMLGVDRLAHRRQRSWSCVPAVVVRCWQLHSVLLPRSFECVIAINRRFTL